MKTVVFFVAPFLCARIYYGMRVFSNTQEGLEILCAICLIRSLAAVQVKRPRAARIIVAVNAARRIGTAVINEFAAIAMAIS